MSDTEGVAVSQEVTDARNGVFQAMGELLEAIDTCLDIEPQGQAAPAFVWVREDGVSLTYGQPAINEVRLCIQAPADEVMARATKGNDSE